MIIDDTNVTANHQRYHTRDIHATVRELLPEQKQKLLDEIQLRKAVCNLTRQDFNHTDCERIEKALRTKEGKK